MPPELLPIELSVKRKSWRIADNHASEHNAAFAAERKQVLDRDDYTCRFCGFRASPDKKGTSWQEVHHLDDDHSNNSRNNLVTACPLCHQCFHMGLAGMKSGGVLIWLPEMTQAQLNHLARALFVAIASGSDYSRSAQGLFAALETRQMFIEEVFAKGASDPSFFGQAMLDLGDGFKVNEQVMHGVRMLPLPGRFVSQIDFWVNHTYAGLRPESWISLAPDALTYDAHGISDEELEMISENHEFDGDPEGDVAGSPESSGKQASEAFDMGAFFPQEGGSSGRTDDEEGKA